MVSVKRVDAVGMSRRLVGAVVLVLGAMAAAGAEKNETLTPGKPVELAGIGVRLRCFDGFDLLPRKFPEARVLRRSDTNETIDVYDPVDLWRFEQTAARFTGDLGTVSVADVRRAFPADVPTIYQQFVGKEQYDATVAAQAPTEWDAASLAAWIGKYAGQAVATGPTEDRALKTDFPCGKFTFADTDETRLCGYLLQVPRGKQKQYVFLLFEFTSEKTFRNLDGALRGCVGSVTAITLKAAPAGATGRGAATAGNRGSTAKGDTPKSRRSPEFEATRRRVLDEVKNMKDWWYAESPNYVIITDLPKGSRGFVEDLRDELEIMRDYYAKFTPEKADITEVSVVRIFKDREAFKDYVGKLGDMFPGGVWMSTRKELVISPVEGASTAENREWMTDTVFHEAFHQYIEYALGRIQPPPWYNEGHAEMFEQATVRNGKVVVRETDPWRVEQLCNSLDRCDVARVRQLIETDYQAFCGTDYKANYVLSWGIIYFLRKAGGLACYRDRGYDKICDRVIEALIENRGDPEAANAAALKCLGQEQFLVDLKEFWHSGTKRGRAGRTDLVPTEK
ncbi:MAG: hypothetical protein A3K19_26665 [Lentisphaerae bacterium RIFOXYB12_FULL_65_16]|nr:MAG: hypothetical protein A3K18_00935 [Lentisphaerae bacterium RIFOXYA12_64_32]OGV84349.1 MAG: hypothetical protein A3K19_26665 [Lentisphaerae bacterium RIFOXYB12_FULL_65_16]